MSDSIFNSQGLFHIPVELTRGKYDPTSHLVNQLSCANCLKSPSKLLTCGRCHCTYYCSKDCQKESYSYHKKFCLEFKRLNNRMKKEELKLRGTEYFDWSENIGAFWGLVDPRNYCSARLFLAEHILHKAHDRETKSLYECGLSHYMELLRLCHGDNLGVRYEVPFILLKLNRDNDAYSFIKWWMTIDPDGTYGWGLVQPNTKEGDWLWLKNQDIYEDVFEVVLKLEKERPLSLPRWMTKKKEENLSEKFQYESLDFLAALTLIKLRIVCKFNLCKLQMKQVQLVMKSILDVNDNNLITQTILTYLSGGNSKYVQNMIEEQTKFAKKYLTQMLFNNEVFVKALVNPAPLKRQPYPNSYSPGSNQEAFLVLNRCCRLYLRTPGARTLIESLVGENPQYDAEFELQPYY